MAYMSEEGYKKLMAELKELETVERPKISAAIAEARDKGDLSENAEYDAEQHADDQRHEEHGPFAAVGGVVRSFDGLYRIFALFDEEIVGERPCDREHDARDDHEEHADENRENHQAHRDEELAHVAAVFAVENAQGIDNLTLGQLCGQ
mgnify:CR=1 FL=1